MEPQVEYLEGHRARLVVRVDEEVLEKGRRAAAKRIGRTLRIPGFRPGKAPYEVIVQYLGEDGLLQDALEEIGNDVYRDALDEANIEPYTAGEITDINTDDGLVLTFEVPRRPVVDLGDYRSVRADFEAREVTDEDVEKSIARTRENIALQETVERPAAIGDQVIINVRGVFTDHKHDHDEQNEEAIDESATDADDTADEAEISAEVAAETTDTPETTEAAQVEAGNETDDSDETETEVSDATEIEATAGEDSKAADDHDHEEIYIDQRQFEFLLLEDAERDLAPGFTAQLVGTTAGEEKTFECTFPEDEEDEDLAGRTVRFTIDVSQVQFVMMPAEDDFLAELVSDSEFDTLDALRERLRENLTEVYEEQTMGEYSDKVIELLVEQASFEYPEETVSDYMDDVIRELEDYMIQQAGLRMEDYLQIIGKTRDDLREENRDRAIRRMKNSLVLTTLAEVENLTVDDADVDKEIEEQIQNYPGGVGGELRRIFESESYRERIATNIITRRTIEQLTDIARGKDPAPGAAPEADADASAETKETPDAEAPATEEAAETTETATTDE